MNSMLEAALAYAAKGYSVFPCKPRSKEPATQHGFKDATTDKEQIRRWWTDNPGYNIGLPTGKVIGFWVLDIDDQKGRESLTKFQDDIPWNTPQVVTGKGYHLYFSCSEGVDEPRGSAGKIGEGLDIRGDGNYVLAPGSVHPSGVVYEYANSHREPTEATERLLSAVKDRSKRRGVDFSQPIPEGERNDTLASFAGWFLSKGVSLEAAKGSLFSINEHQCNPLLPNDEIEEIAEGIYSRYEPGELPIEQSDEVGILMSDVEAEKVEWLWESRIPLGKLTVLDGDPGLGKSVITMDLAARVTTGQAFPNGDIGYVGNLDHLDHLGGVVVLSAEDGLADTIRPRLDAAGADVTKVRALSTVKDDKGNERTLSIPEDIEAIEKAIISVNAKLVLVDPLMAFLSSTVNANYDQQVRQALTPLKEMAERMGVAVLLVRYMSKQEARKSLYRGGGSIGIIGAARCALVVEVHPDNKDLRVLAVNKSNLAEKAASLTYNIATADNDAAKVAWGATTELDANDILNPDTSKLDEAKTWLEGILSDSPLCVNDIKAKAKDEGISEKTLYRAKDALGIESEKDGPDGSWRWHLEDSQDGQHGQDSQDLKLVS